jgi:acetyl/propionyl-CoA carboxylase alpha subunit
VDAGFRAGGVVSSDYDSLLAKVISHAPTRRGAATMLARTLRTSTVTGVRTNIDALVAVLGDDDFLAADTPTAFLDEHPDLVLSTGPGGDRLVALLLGAVFASEQSDRAADPVFGFAPSGWRNLRTMGQRQVWRRDTNGAEHQVEFVVHDRSTATVWLGDWPAPTDDGTLSPDDRRVIHVRMIERTPERQVLEIDGVREVIEVVAPGPRSADSVVHTRSRTGAQSWRPVPRFVTHDADVAGGGPISPLPGTVIAVHVGVGDHVSDGQLLVVVEAMKMEHKITATDDAVVTEVRFAVGDRVDSGDLLVALESRQQEPVLDHEEVAT